MLCLNTLGKRLTQPFSSSSFLLTACVFHCSPFLFISLQKKVSFEPTTSYLLKNLKPFSTYTFQLAAKSKHGIGAYTNEVSIDTPQTRRSHHEYYCVCVCERERERERERESGFNFDDAKIRTGSKNDPQTHETPDLTIIDLSAINKTFGSYSFFALSQQKGHL